jgi:PIN domain nuclease of toxin-antitoxin system
VTGEVASRYSPASLGGRASGLSIGRGSLLIEAQENELFFSTADLWEIVIKRGLGREDFTVDARLLRRGLLDNGYSELPIASEHVVAIEGLPPIHKDPFDRILLAQAQVEGSTLVTADPILAQYSGPVRLV